MASSSNQNRRALYTCYAAMICLAIALNFLPVYLTTFSNTFGHVSGLTGEQLGRIPAIMFFSFIIAILITGPLADRWDARRFVLSGLLTTMTGLGLVAFAPSYGFLLFAVAVMGFGAGILDMILSPIVTALQPERTSAAMNWLHAFFCVGAVGAVIIASFALKWQISWRWVGLGIMAVPFVTFLCFLGVSLPPLIKDAGRREPMPALLKQPYFIACLLAIFLGGATETGLSQWLPGYVELKLGFSKETGGFVLAGFSVGMVLGRVSAAMLQNRVAPLSLMFWCCAATVILFVVISFPPAPVVAIIACLAAGFSGSCLWPTMLAVSSDAYPNGGATMFSVLTAFGNAGCSLVPWLVGIIMEYSDLHIALLTVALCPAGMMVILLWMSRRPPRSR